MERSSTTEADWDNAEETPRKKRRIPSWVWWGFGGGCLTLTVAGIAFGVFAARLLKEGMDPEKQWPRLAEVLPFDERPGSIDLHFGLGIGADQFHMVDREKGLRATVVQYHSSSSEEYGHLMDPDFELPMGFGRLEGPESGKLVVQGHEVPCLRFSRFNSGAEVDTGAGIRVDLTGTRERPRTLELRRHAGAERIEDAEVEGFLAPFDVWRGP